MTKHATMPVLRAVGRAILGAFAGICIGLFFPGILIIVGIYTRVFRPFFGPLTQQKQYLYLYTISGIIRPSPGTRRVIDCEKIR